MSTDALSQKELNGVCAFNFNSLSVAYIIDVFFQTIIYTHMIDQDGLILNELH